MNLPGRPKGVAQKLERTNAKSPRWLANLSERAFTLLEVMIASGILFLCLFAILELLSTSLRNARVLQRSVVDPGMLAAVLSLTNKLSEGPVPRGLGGFEKVYPDYRYDGDIVEVGTNGLYQVNFVVYRRTSHAIESRLSILMFTGQSSQAGRISP